MADSSLNRNEFIAAVAEASGQSTAATGEVVDAIFAVLAKSVGEGTKVSIPGWLAVERTHRSARTGRNPQTGAAIEIKASYGVKVSAGSKLKAAAK
jgi:DNA-binding protein HU-beta